MFVPNHRSARRSINSSNYNSSFHEQDHLMDEEEYGDGGLLDGVGTERERRISPPQVSGSLRSSFGNTEEDSHRFSTS